MQIKKNQSGKTYSLIRTTYCPIKKRGVNSTIGLFDANLKGKHEIESNILDKLTGEEDEQLMDFFQKSYVDGLKAKQLYSVNNISYQMADFINAISRQHINASASLNDSIAADLYEKMKVIRKQLKKSGYPQSRVLSSSCKTMDIGN